MEVSKIIDIKIGNRARVEIHPMSFACLRLSTIDHIGPIKFTVDFLPRCEGDQTFYIHREPEIDEDNHILKKVNKN